MNRIKTIFAVLLFALGAFPQLAQADLTVTASTDATALVNALLGPGVTIVGTPTLTSTAEQSGLFSGGASIGLGIDSGVVLTTGNAVQDPNTTLPETLSLPPPNGGQSGNFSSALNTPGQMKVAFDCC